MRGKLIQLCALLGGVWTLSAGGVDLVYRFPTGNHALVDGRGEDFLMYCDRTFEGVKSKPWEAGGYGMVRNPFRASDGSILYGRLHEGIDIKPMRRDAQGEPLDEVHPIAPGVVAYVNGKPGLSNYGRYVVIAHAVPEGIIYSLYAHLAEIRCSIGQKIGNGNVLGRMGHSGAGINRERSHVHLEVCLMINSAYDTFCPPNNKHGLFNGLNLVGIDPSPLLREGYEGRPVSIARHWETLKEHYRVRVPYNGDPLDILKRHPFLLRGHVTPQTSSMDISFSREGIPLGFYPSQEKTGEPKVIRCLPFPTPQQNVTMNRVKNSSVDAALTVSGRRYVDQFFRQRTTSPPPSPTP